MGRKLTRLGRKLTWLFTVYLQSPHVATVQTKNGLLSFYNKDRTLGRSLYIEREFEFDGMQSCVKLLVDNKHIAEPQNGTVMDVGGYIGMIGIGFLTAKLFNKALMFEPNPDSFKLIEKNIKQNNMTDSIYAFNLALSNEESELLMELSHKNYGDHRIRKEGDVESGHYDEDKRKTIKVRAVTLDDFAAENSAIDFADVKMIWMDIQGHEGNFLQGATGFLQTHKHIPVAMEFWPYGLLRAGVTKAVFCTLVKSLFSHFYILDNNDNTLYDCTKIDHYFDIYGATPAGGCHLILVNK